MTEQQQIFIEEIKSKTVETPCIDLIVGNTPTTLKQCIEEYQKEEPIEFNKEDGTPYENPKKKNTPQHNSRNKSVFGLKRFTHDSEYNPVKLFTEIEIPFDYENKDLTYIGIHQGSTEGGHYYAYRKIAGEWYECYDSRVSKIENFEENVDIQNTIKKNAYLVAYTSTKIIGKESDNQIFDPNPFLGNFTADERTIEGAFEGLPDGKYKIRHLLDFGRGKILSVTVKNKKVQTCNLEELSAPAFLQDQKNHELTDVTDPMIRRMYHSKKGTQETNPQVKKIIQKCQGKDKRQKIEGPDNEFRDQTIESIFKGLPDGKYQISYAVPQGYMKTIYVTIHNNKITECHEGNFSFFSSDSEVLDKEYIDVSNKQTRDFIVRNKPSS